MRRRPLIVLGLLIVAGLAAGLWFATGFDPVERLWVRSRPPVVVGLLHSRTGAMAISERSLLDAETLALEEVNVRGGVAGRPLRWVVEDGRSDPRAFADRARRLIDEEKVSVLFGCWTAECRKAVEAVVVEKGNLLIFPSNHEGLERSGRTIATGGSVNQIVGPAVRWAVDSIGARRFFVVSSDDLWSRTAAEVAKDSVKAAGCEVVGEAFLPIAGADVGPAVGAIGEAKPDVVLDAMVGSSNAAFLASLRKSGVAAEARPVIAFAVAEDELRRIPAGDFAGHYSALNYFQSVDRPENRDFVRKFRARFGDDRVVSDSIVAAYNGVLLWAQAANEAQAADPTAVLDHFDRQSLDGPEGVVTIDPASHVVWRPFHLGRARADGQFDVAWSMDKPIRPAIRTLTRSRGEWRAFLEKHQAAK